MIPKNYETIDGRKILMSPAGYHHNKVMQRLFNIISQHIEKDFEVVQDTFIRMNSNILAPDIAIFKKPLMVSNDIITGTPDFVIEVLSPSTRKYDIGEKKTLYANSGVKEYWIVEPKQQDIDVYTLKNNSYELTESYHNYSDEEKELLHEEQINAIKETVQSVLYGFAINIKDIFEE